MKRLFLFIIILTMLLTRCNEGEDDLDIDENRYPTTRDEWIKSTENASIILNESAIIVENAISKAYNQNTLVNPDEIANMIKSIEGVRSAQPDPAGLGIKIEQNNGTLSYILLVNMNDNRMFIESGGKSIDGTTESLEDMEGNFYFPNGNGKALILSPFQRESLFNLDGIANRLKAAGFTPIDILKNEQADVDAFRGSFLNDYDVVIILTHTYIGEVGPENNKVQSTLLLTGQKTSNITGFTTDDFSYLGQVRAESKGNVYPYWALSVPWLKLTTNDGKFNNAWIYAGGCVTALSPDLYNAFFSLGAGGFNGFTQSVASGFNYDVLLKMLTEFASGLSFSEAWENVISDPSLKKISWEIRIIQKDKADINSFVYRQSKNEPFYLIEPIAATIPTVSTSTITDITQASAAVGGNVTNSGGANVTERGVYWSITQNPESTGTKLQIGSGTGIYSTILTGLASASTYYVRAYATNSAGTAYGNQASFTTNQSVTLPTVTTSTVTSITQSSATGGGNVTATGGATVTARGIAYGTSQNPTISGSTVSAGSGTGSFTANMSGLSSNSTYYVRAYATNSAGTAYGSQVSFTTSQAVTLATVATSTVTNITTTSATGGGNVTATGGATVTARGIAYGTSQNPTFSGSTVSASSGTGSFTANMSGLSPNTTYYVRAYATNSAGTAYGSQVSFTTSSGGTGGFNDVYNPATGKTWMDRNLGASRVATSSTDAQAYGDLYQWGRSTDGHQLRTSSTTTTLSSTDTPGHGNFILAPNNPWDWRSPQNTNLWQGVNGVNNPCPAGYRLPTEAEWNTERLSWSTNNTAGAFTSPLKMTVAGGRNVSPGSIGNLGSHGYYWSSTVESTYFSSVLVFSSDDAGMHGHSRAQGLSVRCIKD